MSLFLILSPFAVLSAVALIASAQAAMFCAALTASALVAIDLVRGRSAKLLQIGTALLLTGVGSYIVLIDSHLNGAAARTAVDAGLLTIALLSLALRFPFTIQYAREKVDAATAARPDFHRANIILTWVWAAAFVTMLTADLAAIYWPWLPLWTGIAAAIVARNAAAWFTTWYSAHRRAAAAAEGARLKAFTSHGETA